MSLKSFFSLRKPKETLAVVFDVGNASIGGALVLLSLDNPPKLMYTVRRELHLQKKLDFRRFITSMGVTLEAVARDIEKNGLPHLHFTKLGSVVPTASFCILSSPWHASQVRAVTVSHKEPFKITHTMISRIIEKEITSLKQSQLER